MTETLEPELRAKPASVMTINFAKAESIRLHKSGRIRDRGHASDARPRTPEGKLLTPKQIRARARRRAQKKRQESMTEQEFEALYKPVDEWDLEELARGRPRNAEGNFRGRKPSWITREVHERAMEQFKLAVKTEMGAQSITALDTLRWVLENEETDERGKPLVNASAKNQAAMFLLEHVVGKPTQRVESDISVKLQAILGTVMVNPNDALAPGDQGGELTQGDGLPGYQLAHYPGHTIPIGTAEIVPGELADDEDEEDE